MREDERVLLCERRAYHPVHVVMTVLLDVLESEQARQREILLHRRPGLSGQILRGHEIPRGSIAVPASTARAVQDRLVQTLTRLDGHARVAVRPRGDEASDLGVRF